MPHRAAGWRIDPPVSLPKAAGHSPAVTDAADSRRLPDPESFRLEPIGPDRQIRSIRDTGHFPWSAPIGLLLFLLYGGIRFGLSRPDVFHTAAEVEAATGLRLIGKIGISP